MDWHDYLRPTGLLIIPVSVAFAIAGRCVYELEMKAHGKMGLISKVIFNLAFLIFTIGLLSIFAGRIIDDFGLFTEPLP